MIGGCRVQIFQVFLNEPLLLGVHVAANTIRTLAK